MKSSRSSTAEQRRETFSVGHSHSADDTGEDSPFSRPNIAEQTIDDHLFGSTTGTPMVSTDSVYGVKSKELSSANTGRADSDSDFIISHYLQSVNNITHYWQKIYLLK